MKILKRIAFGVLALTLSGVALAQTTLPPFITGTNELNKTMVDHVGILRLARNEALTATASGTLANSVVLNRGLNRVTTVASTNDGTTLPQLSGGIMIIVINAGANPMRVYPNSATGTINALGAGNPIVIAANARVMFVQADDGVWYTLPLLPS